MQDLGRAGADVWEIQVLARRSSNDILLYLIGFRNDTLKCIAADGGLAHTVQAMQRDLKHLVDFVHVRPSVTASTGPLLELEPFEPPPVGKAVWMPRAHSRLHCRPEQNAVYPLFLAVDRVPRDFHGSAGQSGLNVR